MLPATKLRPRWIVTMGGSEKEKEIKSETEIQWEQIQLEQKEIISESIPRKSY
jgi:hypothetical protein